MNVTKTDIHDVLILEPQVFGDERGFFMESFNHKNFSEIVGYQVDFVQDNHSKSSKGVLRGLHFQLPPYSQGKLVRCIAGEVYDVAVDIRPESPSYGKWVGVNLSAQNRRQLWIPEGLAHGFLTLTDDTEFVYKTTNYYQPSVERTIKWDDEFLNIQWPAQPRSISEKDKKGLRFPEV